MATKPKEKPHYVNNREFSLAVVEYCTKVKEEVGKETLDLSLPITLLLVF